MYTNIAALVRVYAKNTNKVEGVVSQIRNTVTQLRQVGIGTTFVSIWQDVNQPDSDCGDTSAAMCKHFADDSSVTVIEAGGDLFVNALNVPLREMVRDGCTHALVLSATASGIITQGVVASMHEAINSGAQAVAVVHPEFPDLVKRGYITNTHALWDIKTLLGMGGFDPIDIRPVDFTASVHIQGVGEAMNVIKLTRVLSNPVLAIIESGALQGDTRTDAVHKAKIVNKYRRSEAMLKAFGSTWEELESCIMRGYPRKV